MCECSRVCPQFTRRAILASALSLAPFVAALRPAWAEVSADKARERWIELRNTHTSEVLSVTFHDGTNFIPDALAKLQHLLRDHRADEEYAMDSALYVLLSDLARAAGAEPRYEVISGYRSPGTNASLRAQGRRVAQRSLHMEGRAIDVRPTQFSTAKLRDLALQMRRGGVGYYPDSDFVHLDTGRVRRWEG